MAILVKLSASLRNYVPEYNPTAGLSMPLPPDRTVAGVLNAAGVPADKVKIIMINGVSASLDSTLSDGDRLGLFPPVGGG